MCTCAGSEWRERCRVPFFALSELRPTPTTLTVAFRDQPVSPGPGISFVLHFVPLLFHQWFLFLRACLGFVHYPGIREPPTQRVT